MNTIKPLGDAITFRYLPTEKFTTDYFSVHFILPLEKETVAGYSLLTKLFKKGCRSYPTQGALARRLEELYASTLEISVSTDGAPVVSPNDAEALNCSSSLFSCSNSAVVHAAKAAANIIKIKHQLTLLIHFTRFFIRNPPFSLDL